jgi:glycosyltransferase involved in cell wall biosynthesis
VTTLLLNHFFPPDPAPTGLLTADLARELAAQGCAVTVICGRAGYRQGEAAERPPVRVLQVPALPFGRGAASRMACYLSFLAGALARGLAAGKPEVVVTLTTPPLLSLVGAAIQRLRGARHYIWEMDVYPDVAVALGVLKPHSRLTRALGALADYARRRADGIIVLGPCMKDRLAARGIPPERIHVAENWADGRLIQPLPFPGEMGIVPRMADTATPEHENPGQAGASTGGPPSQSPIFEGVPTSPLTVLYSGNLGLAHDFDTVCAAMARLASDARFQFVFAGDGPRRRTVEDFCRAHAIRNARFLPYQESARLSEHFGACHVGLVTQTPESLGTVVPSKIYALMAAARPVIFIGPRQATPALTLERFRCGWQIDPGDSESLIALLQLLASNPGLLRDAGHRARQAFLQHYDLPIGVARIAAILQLSKTTQTLATSR